MIGKKLLNAHASIIYTSINAMRTVVDHCPRDCTQLAMHLAATKPTLCNETAPARDLLIRAIAAIEEGGGGGEGRHATQRRGAAFFTRIIMIWKEHELLTIRSPVFLF